MTAIDEERKVLTRRDFLKGAAVGAAALAGATAHAHGLHAPSPPPRDLTGRRAGASIAQGLELVMFRITVTGQAQRRERPRALLERRDRPHRAEYIRRRHLQQLRGSMPTRCEGAGAQARVRSSPRASQTSPYTSDQRKDRPPRVRHRRIASAFRVGRF